MTTSLLFPLPMNMLSDVLAAIKQKYRQIDKLSNQQSRRLRNMRATAKLISNLLNRPLEMISIEELAEVNAQRLTQSNLTKKSSQAVGHQLRMCECLMDEAHAALGWTCPAYRVLHSWKPLKAVIRKRMLSCRKIVDDAIDKGIKARDYCDDDLKEWRKAALKQGHSAPYLDHTITWLRIAIRKNGLQKQFPSLDVSLRKPETYVLPLSEVGPTLAAQIQDVHAWAVEDPEFKKTKRTAGEIFYMLRELTSFAIKRGADIAEIKSAVTEEWVCSWADWRLRHGKVRPKTVEVSLGRLRSLVKQHALFAGGNYKWLDYKIRSILREPKSERRERKRKKLVPYQLVAQIPSKIRADRSAILNPTPEQLAWSVHDELFMSMPPWRKANHSGVAIKGNIIESEMMDGMWHKLLNVPDWIHEELKKDPHRNFVFFHFVEDEMKGKKEIWEVLDRDIEDLYRNYRTKYRSTLVRGMDPGSLFLGRDGRALRSSGLSWLMADISSRYLPKRLSHHLRRDCISVGMIIAGATYEQVGAALHHSLNGGESTDEYLVALPLIGRAAVLEQEVAMLAREMKLNFTESPDEAYQQ